MSKIEEVRKDMVTAMKAGEKERKATLSALLTALKNKAIDKRADLTEEEEVQVILKEIKQTKETLDTTPADRTDIIEECTKRLSVLEEYAPKMMDTEEIKAVIQEVLSALGIDVVMPSCSDMLDQRTRFSSDIYLDSVDTAVGHIGNRKVNHAISSQKGECRD